MKLLILVAATPDDPAGIGTVNAGIAADRGAPHAMVDAAARRTRAANPR